MYTCGIPFRLTSVRYCMEVASHVVEVHVPPTKIMYAYTEIGIVNHNVGGED